MKTLNDGAESAPDDARPTTRNLAQYAWAYRLPRYDTGEGERVSRANELYITKRRLLAIVHEYVVRDTAGQRSSWVAPNQGYLAKCAKPSSL